MVFDAFVRAGLSEMTNCGLPGEVIGKLSDSQLKNPIVRMMLAYGYGLTVTPPQRPGLFDAGEWRSAVAGLDPAPRRSANGSA